MINNFLKFFFKLSRSNELLFILIFDGLAISFSFIVSVWIRLDNVNFIFYDSFFKLLFICLFNSILILAVFGFYRAIIRYASNKTMYILILGITISAIATYIISKLIIFLPETNAYGLPRSIPLIFILISISLMAGIRLILKATYIIKIGNNKKENIIIYGAGSAGQQLLDNFSYNHEYTVIAFIDDDSRLRNREVGGLKVYPLKRLEKLINKHSVKILLLAMPSISKLEKFKKIDKLKAFDLEIKTIPSISDILNGNADLTDIKNISIDELLGREPVLPDPELLGVNIENKVVMVSGAGGSIGSELCRQVIKSKPRTLLLLDISEFAIYTISEELKDYQEANKTKIEIIEIIGSVQDLKCIQGIFDSHKVNTIYHAAAYKHVPLIESNIIEGLKNNILGTRNLTTKAVENLVESFIFISTDKAVRPTNIMGASKRIAELICQDLAKHQNRTVFSIVRFGNVLGSSGSIIPKFKKQIQSGGPVTVTHKEITRYFMTITEASQLVIQAGALANGGEVFLLEMGESVKIFELAKKMILLHGHKFINEEDYKTNQDKDNILIKVVGLRPGEKLYEELLIGTDSLKTKHPRIYMANEVSLDSRKLNNIIDEFVSYAGANEVKKIRILLKESEIGYKPNLQ